MYLGSSMGSGNTYLPRVTLLLPFDFTRRFVFFYFELLLAPLFLHTHWCWGPSVRGSFAWVFILPPSWCILTLVINGCGAAGSFHCTQVYPVMGFPFERWLASLLDNANYRSHWFCHLLEFNVSSLIIIRMPSLCQYLLISFILPFGNIFTSCDSLYSFFALVSCTRWHWGLSDAFEITPSQLLRFC